MKKITFTTAGIAALLLLQLGTMAFVIFGRNHHRGEHAQRFRGPQGHHVAHKGGGPDRHEGFHGNHRGPHHEGPHMFLEGLDLTKEQQTKIDALKQEFHKSQETSHAQVKELRMKQFQLLRDEKLDDIQAESIATQLGQFKKDEALARMKFFREVQKVLTKEQKEKLKERFQNRGHEDRQED